MHLYPTYHIKFQEMIEKIPLRSLKKNPRKTRKTAVNKPGMLRKQNTGLSWWLSGKESTCQRRRHRFDPRAGKAPHATSD